MHTHGLTINEAFCMLGREKGNTMHMLFPFFLQILYFILAQAPAFQFIMAKVNS